MRLPINQA